MNNYLFTSESVTEGHPDKMCDIISDTILDAYIEQDPDSRVACEVTATTGIITVMGEITSKATIDINSIVRKTVEDIGYKDDTFGFNAKTCAVSISVDQQSEDISIGVSSSLEHKDALGSCSLCEDCHKVDGKEMIGAGDQGMMFGMACNDTENLMPAPIYYANKLCERLSYVRKNNILEYLGPDGKSMVTFKYNNGKPEEIHTIVISTQHLPTISQKKLKEDMIEHVINYVIPLELRNSYIHILINPTGRFVHGGPSADTGLTGRKIIVDTYGGMGRHGGGAFSGKDPTKVDRTGAYAARYVAKNIVASGIAEKCEVQIAYAIGVANPVSINVNTFGTSKISDEKMVDMINKVFDLRPASLIAQFNMKRPIYKALAAYGHVGRNDLDVIWEKTDKINKIKESLPDRR